MFYLHFFSILFTCATNSSNSSNTAKPTDTSNTTDSSSTSERTVTWNQDTLQNSNLSLYKIYYECVSDIFGNFCLGRLDALWSYSCKMVGS